MPRAWRLYSTANVSGNNAFSFRRIIFRSSNGGLDVSTSVSAEAFADYVFPLGDSYAPKNAFNPDEAFYNNVAQTPYPHFIGLNVLASALAFVEEVTLQADGGNVGLENFTIQYSDDEGETWLAYWSVSGIPNWGFLETRTFQRVPDEDPGPDPEPEPEIDETALQRYTASVPTFVVEIACLEFNHSAWAEPHRRVIQPDDWTVTIDGVPTLFPGWNEVGPWGGEYPGSDESARASRTLSLDDPFDELHNLIEAVIEVDEPVVCRLWLFRSDILDVPLIAERYEVASSEPGGDRTVIACVSADPSLRIDPHIKHTYANSPGLH